MNVNINSIRVDGIDMNDYPDFCDAYISYAEHGDGKPLTEEELEKLNEDKYLVNQSVINHIY